MKNIYSLCLLAITLFFSNAIYSQCAPPSATQEVHSSSASTVITSGQGMWNQNSMPYYETEDAGGPNAFYAGGLWISGFSVDNSLKMAVSTYGLNGSDFFSGPLAIESAEASEETCYLYDRIFVIQRQEVITHLAYFDAVDNGTDSEEFPFGYEIPNSILDYPAHGDVSQGQALNLAPFYDRDNDGFYDPSVGDCPLFSGMVETTDCQTCDALQGDVAYFWINNDKGNIHTESSSLPMGIEIQNMAYVFLDQEGLPLAKNVFYQKKIINRGTQAFHDVRLGIFADPDIGNSQDDYLGCNIEQNLGYAYNGDAFDEDVFGIIGYGEESNIPAAGIVLLQGPRANPTGLDEDEDGIIDNETLGMTGFLPILIPSSNFGFPITAMEFNNLLHNHWADGMPLIYGGNGLDGDSTLVTQYAYPDDFIMEGQSAWSEGNSENSPGDRKFVMTTGPVDLNPNESICIKYATVIGDPNDDQTAIEAIHSNTDAIIDMFGSCFAGLTANLQEVSEESQEIIFDSYSHSLTIATAIQENHQLSIVNSLGQLVVKNNFYQNYSSTLNALSAGVYIVKVENKRGAIKTKKICIN